MRWIAAASFAVLLGIAASDAHGEGNGRGLGRALGKAGGKATAPGMNKAGSAMARAGGGLGKAKGLARAPGITRGIAGKGADIAIAKTDAELPEVPPDPVVHHERQLQNEQRQLDHRIAQAQKLRELADRNGNPELRANADRMEQQALQQYEDRLSQLESLGDGGPALNPPENEIESTPLVTPYSAGETPIPPQQGKPAPTRSESRGWLKPKWLTR